MKWHSIVCGVLCIFSLIVPWIPTSTKYLEEKKIVSVWNVDTFEGGKGSRTAFLEKVAKKIEKENNVYYLITSHTKESVERNFAKGVYPDLLSSGIGFSIGEQSVWCRGGYVLFSLEDSFENVTTQNTVLSYQENASVEMAGRMYGLEGDFVLEDSLTAYVHFLNGKYQYLLGTQRDVCRFESRNISYYTREIAYSDLFQTISITTKDPTLSDLSQKFVDCLLSEDVQCMLNEIGMIGSVDCYEGELKKMFHTEMIEQVPLYTSFETMSEMKEIARMNSDKKLFKKYLKPIAN